jgi:glycosyltransferase involved in cell wall biosynthesis
MKVVYFYRKKAEGVYSIEQLFEGIRMSLPHHIHTTAKEMKFTGRGLFKRLYICIEAAMNQKEINHITGDIHFIAIFLKRRRTVLTIHDLGFMGHPNLFIRFLLKKFWITEPVKHCAAITVISHATKQELLKHIPEKYSSIIHVIHNPANSFFQTVQRKFNSDKPTILQIGTKYNKNLMRLIAALEGINCKLEIVGSLTKPIIDMLIDLKIEYSMSENLTTREVLDKYIACDVLSFVSIFEGFGLPILEANSVGRVVVTSNISSMPEIAGNAAHFVNPFDVESIRKGFLQVIGDSTYREQLILNGFENIKRFDSVTIANRYTRLYESLFKTA